MNITTHGTDDRAVVGEIDVEIMASQVSYVQINTENPASVANLLVKMAQQLNANPLFVSKSQQERVFCLNINQITPPQVRALEAVLLALDFHTYVQRESKRPIWWPGVAFEPNYSLFWSKWPHLIRNDDKVIYNPKTKPRLDILSKLGLSITPVIPPQECVNQSDIDAFNDGFCANQP